MKTYLSATSRLVCFAAALASTAAAEELTKGVNIARRTFHIPVDCTLELVAGPPLVDRPICSDFDERGFLYVADSSGSNAPVEEQLAKPTHRIVRLEDADGDGVFESSVVFADSVMFPEGILWHDGSLYVAAPPAIWKLTDEDGDGAADRREEWFNPGTLTGCANDLHGPYLGRDGYIYWCKGAFAEQTHPQADGGVLKTRAAHIFRRRPEGGIVEAVMTGGMDNPVEVVFTPGGERIFTTTFLQHPAGGQRDGIIHAIRGAVYGKRHDVIDDHPWTGAPPAPLVHLGAAAPAGLAQLEGDAFGRESLVACQFNMHKLTRHELSPSGSTFAATNEDFIVCDDLDFHPTDVIEDADCSLLIIDTGGWYKLCCPTSQLAKADVLGAIYRLRRDGKHDAADPWGEQINWREATTRELIALFGDERPQVRRRARSELLRRSPDETLSKLSIAAMSDPTPQVRLHALWTWAAQPRAVLTDAKTKGEMPFDALSDEQAVIRQAAAHVFGLHRIEVGDRLIDLLDDEDLAVRRAAAEALGRQEQADNVPHLLLAIGKTDDALLRITLLYALIETDAGEEASGKLDLVDGLLNENSKIRVASLLALAEMAGRPLTDEQLSAAAGDEDRNVRSLARTLAVKRPHLREVVAGVYADRLAAEPSITSPIELPEVLAAIADFAESTAMQRGLLQHLQSETASASEKTTVLHALARANRDLEWPAWHAVASGLLASENDELVRSAVLASRRVSGTTPEQSVGALRNVASREDMDVPTRLSALTAVRPGLQYVDADEFSLLLRSLTDDPYSETQQLAGDVLSRATLTLGQLKQLAAALAELPPTEVSQLLATFKGRTEADLASIIYDSLHTTGAAPVVGEERLRETLRAFGDSFMRKASALIEASETNLAERRAQLHDLLARLPAGDVRSGQRLFHDQKLACKQCHAIGYLGGRVGPDLTRIGGVRTRTDLLESILYPNLSIARSYESTALLLADGRTVTGVIQAQTPEQITLATGVDQTISVRREEIEVESPSALSIMPQGLDKQLSAQQLADLLAFLEANR